MTFEHKAQVYLTMLCCQLDTVIGKHSHLYVSLISFKCRTSLEKISIIVLIGIMVEWNYTVYTKTSAAVLVPEMCP